MGQVLVDYYDGRYWVIDEAHQYGEPFQTLEEADEYANRLSDLSPYQRSGYIKGKRGLMYD